MKRGGSGATGEGTVKGSLGAKTAQGTVSVKGGRGYVDIGNNKQVAVRQEKRQKTRDIAAKKLREQRAVLQQRLRDGKISMKQYTNSLARLKAAVRGAGTGTVNLGNRQVSIVGILAG